MVETINTPDIERIKKIINKWVTYYPRITKVYLFGSCVRKNKPYIDDIDIAIEISNKDNDTALNFWCYEGERIEEQLSHFLNYKVDLEWFNGEETPTIKKGLDEGNIVIYEAKDIV